MNFRPYLPLHQNHRKCLRPTNRWVLTARRQGILVGHLFTSTTVRDLIAMDRLRKLTFIILAHIFVLVLFLVAVAFAILIVVVTVLIAILCSE